MTRGSQTLALFLFGNGAHEERHPPYGMLDVFLNAQLENDLEVRILLLQADAFV